MKKHSILFRMICLLCAGALLCLCAGCSGAGTNISGSASSPVESAPVEVEDKVPPLLTEAAGPAEESVPDSAASGPAEQSAPDAAADATNSPLPAPNDALDGCLGWGEGTAGSSMKSTSAALDLLRWATDAQLNTHTAAEITDAFTAWYGALEDFQQENFAETWPIVCDKADTLLKGGDNAANVLAGLELSTDVLDGLSADCWQSLCKAVNI